MTEFIANHSGNNRTLRDFINTSENIQFFEPIILGKIS